MRAWWLSLCVLFSAAVASEKPAVMLAKIYAQATKPVSEYWISEKLDGVRARWDGQQLVSRGGNVFAAPAWFTAGFPPTPLDGELWSARGEYEKISSITSRHNAHEGWRAIKLMVFDLPAHGGAFSARVADMRRLVADNPSPYLAMIEQYRLPNNQALQQQLAAIVAANGEGLMLHHQAAVYRQGRSGDLLKLKQFTDAEATVLGYKPGKGKYQGLVGSLAVQDARGKTFYIGSGLSDAQRATPPPIGAIITFRHQGLTANGVPRFPVFIRVRDEK